jgi:hypothetical protein
MAGVMGVERTAGHLQLLVQQLREGPRQQQHYYIHGYVNHTERSKNQRQVQACLDDVLHGGEAER